jgi:hypothetical protein
MCVAIVVESDSGPSERDMFLMDAENPHGVGVAWALGDLVRYKKGLTWQQAHELLKAIPRPALLHFRWATHGGLDRAMTHPFPLGRKALKTRKLNGAAKAVLIHNGVWRDYTKFAPKGTDLDRWSDTAVAAYAAGEYGEDILEFVDWATAVARAPGGGRLDVTLRGNWEEYEGNHYSNLLWRPTRKPRIRVTPSGGLEFLQDEWTEYFDRSIQPSHSAYDMDPMDVDFPRWDADGKLISRGKYATGIAPQETISTWLEELDVANEACAELPPIKVKP